MKEGMQQKEVAAKVPRQEPKIERLIGIPQNNGQQLKIREALISHDWDIIGKTPEEVEREGLSSGVEDFSMRIAKGELGNKEISELLLHIKAPVSDEENEQQTREKEVTELHAQIADHTGTYLDMPKLVARLLAKKEIGTPLSVLELSEFLKRYPEPGMIEHRIAHELAANDQREDIPEELRNGFPNFLRLTLQTLYGKRMEYLEQFLIMQSEARERYGDRTPKKDPEIANKEESKEGFMLESQEMTLASPTHPESNQDRTLNNTAEGLYGVFDGVGGEAGGEKASTIAKTTIEEYIGENKANVQTLDEAKNLVRDAIKAAHAAIIRAKEENPNFKNMATTVTLGFVFEGHMIVGNVGDSRLYRGRRNEYGKGILEQLSVDDSMIPLKLRKKFNNVVNPEQELTPDELAIWKKRNIITSALGANVFDEPAIQIFDIAHGDKFLFSSDGLTDPIGDNELAEALFPDLKKENEKKSSPELLREAVARAREGTPSDSNRDKHDDISYVFVSVVQKNSHGIMPISEARDRVRASEGKRAEQSSIRGAQNFLELYENITHAGGLQSSEKYYPAAELLTLIDHVRKGELDISFVTRTEGLRNKVHELIQREKMKKSGDV